MQCVSPLILILPVKDRHFRAFYALKPINIRHKIENFVAGLLQMKHLQQPLLFYLVWIFYNNKFDALLIKAGEILLGGIPVGDDGLQSVGGADADD